MLKFILISFAFFILINVIQCKFYDTYAASDECIPTKQCKFNGYILQQRAFVRGVLNPALNANFDEEFLVCQESLFHCGYLPLHLLRNEMVINSLSGIKIGVGIDLGKEKEDTLKEMEINPQLIEKIKPYLGLTGESAYKYLLKHPLVINNEEERELTTKVLNKYFDKMAKEYEKLRDQNKSKEIKEISLSIRTALFSLFYSTGTLQHEELLPNLVINSWDKVHECIAKIKYDQQRRNLEALLLFSERIFFRRDCFQMFLIDLSSDVTDEQILKQYEIIHDLIKSDVNESSMMSVFFYSNVLEQIIGFGHSSNEILEALSPLKPSTKKSRILGGAIDKAYDFYINYFTNKTDNYAYADISNIGDSDSIIPYGENVNIVSFVVGKSLDSPKEYIKKAYEKGINTVLIGLDKEVNVDYLDSITNELVDSIYIEDIKQSNQFITLIETVITSNTPILPLNTTIETELYGVTSPNIYRIKKGHNYNLEIKVITEKDNQKLSIYASYNFVFPDDDSFDQKHTGEASSSTKILVIGRSAKYYRSYTDTEWVHLSIIGEAGKYNLTVNECDPVICQTGNNDVIITANNIKWVIIVCLAILVICLVIAGITRWKKNEPTITDFRTSFVSIKAETLPINVK